MVYDRELSIPVVLDTFSKGGAIEHAARFVYGELRQRAGVRTRLIGAAEMEFGMQGEPDAIVFLAPEADVRLAGYDDTPTGVVAVSTGSLHGTGSIETSLAVLRELGRLTLFWDVDARNDGESFAGRHGLSDEAVARGTERFLSELIRMASGLRRGELALAGSAGPPQDGR